MNREPSDLCQKWNSIGRDISWGHCRFAKDAHSVSQLSYTFCVVISPAVSLKTNKIIFTLRQQATVNIFVSDEVCQLILMCQLATW